MQRLKALRVGHVVLVLVLMLVLMLVLVLHELGRGRS
jgi:hypothetical protein